jgi:hypothetical protein
MKTENMGWQCPNCLVVYAPSVEKCECGAIPVLTKDEFKATNPLSGGSIVGLSGTAGTISTSTAYICPSFTTNSSSASAVCSRCGQPQWKHYNLANI